MSKICSKQKTKLLQDHLLSFENWQRLVEILNNFVEPEVVSCHFDPVDTDVFSLRLVQLSDELESFLILLVHLKGKFQLDLLSVESHVEVWWLDVLEEPIEENQLILERLVHEVVQESQNKT